jgi:hypothetical protein
VRCLTDAAPRNDVAERNEKNGWTFRSMAMNCFDATIPIYDAAAIAVRYFVARGYAPTQAHQRTMKYITEMYGRGEQRTLMLANRAIEAVEREEQAERELMDASLEALFRELR